MAIFKRESEAAEIDAGKAVEAKFASLETTIHELKTNSVTKTDFDGLANTLKALNDRETAKETAAQKEKERQQAANQPAYNAEEAFNDFANDPRAALNRAVAPAAKAAILALSKQTRQEVLGDKEYYHGEFKRKVDQMIDSGTQDMQQLTNPSYILNCYRVVLAEAHEQGELERHKRGAAMHGFSDAGNAGAARETNATPTIDYRDNGAHSAAQTKYAAAKLGLTDEDIIAAAKEGTIHGLEVLA